MKKFLVIICLLFIPIVFGGMSKSPSPLFETYIGVNKSDITDDLTSKGEKFLISDKIEVRVDSLNRWIINDNYYTFFFDFEDGSRLTTSYSTKTNLCTNYLFDFTSFNYRENIDLFNESLEKIDSLTWYEPYTKSIIKIFQKGYRNGYCMYVYKKTSKPMIDFNNIKN